MKCITVMPKAGGAFQVKVERESAFSTKVEIQVLSVDQSIKYYRETIEFGNAGIATDFVNGYKTSWAKDVVQRYLLWKFKNDTKKS